MIQTYNLLQQKTFQKYSLISFCMYSAKLRSPKTTTKSQRTYMSEGERMDGKFKRGCKHDCGGKGLLLSDSSYLLPFSAQPFFLIFISFCVFFPLRSVGERFLRTKKQYSKSIVPLGCINFKRYDASVSLPKLDKIKPACFCYSDSSVILS